MAKSLRSSLQPLQRHLDWMIQNLDVAMTFEQSSAPFSCFVKPVLRLPSMTPPLLSAGKQGRWRQRFAQFKYNKPTSIFEVQEWFEKPFTCYLVAPVQLEFHFHIGPDCYVGSTILCLHKRQDTRIRKLRQLPLMQPVHAELMLHWQVSRKQFSLVAHMDTQRQIQTVEMTLIQRWNPSLNFLSF